MSRNARSNSRVRIDKISSNQENVDGFNAFGEFNQIRQSEINDFDEFSPFSFLHTFLDVSLKLYIEKKNNWQRSCTPFEYRYEGGNGPLYIYIYRNKIGLPFECQLYPSEIPPSLPCLGFESLY